VVDKKLGQNKKRARQKKRAPPRVTDCCDTKRLTVMKKKRSCPNDETGNWGIARLGEEVVGGVEDVGCDEKSAFSKHELASETMLAMCQTSRLNRWNNPCKILSFFFVRWPARIGLFQGF